MANPWLAAALRSGLNPPLAPAEYSSSPALLRPPDPPDSSHSLSSTNFPPLAFSPSPSSSSPFQNSSPTAFVEPENVVLALPVHHISRPVVVKHPTQSPVTSLQEVAAINPNSESHSVILTLPPPSSFPDSSNTGILPTPSLPVSSQTEINASTPCSGDAPGFKPASTKTIGPSANTHTPPPIPQKLKTWAERIKRDTDRSLERLAPISYSPEGKPRIAIPDSVFQEEADLHKDFIICRFKGRPPSYTHIHNVLSHLWGKGQRLEIHLNIVNHSMLVRIPNEFIRTKVLLKKLWYIGECIFTVAQWDSTGGSSQDLDAIPIWAHLQGMPFNLMHRKGISLVAGLIGEPIERDEYTMNLVSLTEAHVKVEVNLNKPLPSLVEVSRDDGSIIEINVVYPWTPPTCSNCKLLGHVIRYCPLLPPTTNAGKKIRCGR
ncbi:unnamed protein product [Thlaspi arvense]|uniref:DUF4283 domain-containing protein n=1 Tax=Thlaspi arvense TaxID=13288 RepID=A0AAU9SFR7_THLAR|nr:unnamed protein product [Thlaspi arvense]